MESIIPVKNSLPVKKQRQKIIKKLGQIKHQVWQLGPAVLQKLQAAKNLKSGWIQKNVRQWTLNRSKSKTPSKGQRRNLQNALAGLKSSVKKLQLKRNKRNR